MTETSARAMWIAYRDRDDAEQVAAKNSQQVVLDLFRLYRSLTVEERSEIDQLLAEQLGSNDPTLRFDSQAVIQEFGITSATDALRKLEARLSDSTPQDRDEKEWVARLINELQDTK